MRGKWRAGALGGLLAAGSVFAAEPAGKFPSTTAEILAAAPAEAWRPIPAENLLRMELGDGRAVIIEIIFNIQAMGQLILDGVTRNDVYLVQGVTLTVAIAFIVINIIVDLLYVLVNPRIRTV